MTLARAVLGSSAVAPVPGTAAAAVAWRSHGRLYVTVIAKATFAFVPEGPMARTDPQEILVGEVHHDRNPARSVRLTSDLCPALHHAEVIFTGSAYAPAGRTTAMPVRLAVFDGQRALIDKRLLVRDDAGFERMPLVYERAAAGRDPQENPVATPGVEPAVVDPAAPQRPAGLGPISQAWPARRRLLGAAGAALDRPIAEIPVGFDWAYFQAAPPDQRVGRLRGDEWIVLEGLHPTARILRTRLPDAHAHAWIHGLDAFGIQAGHGLALRADTLRIDGDEQRCTLVWRQSFPVAGEAALAALRLVVESTVAGEPVGAPKPERPAPAAVHDDPDEPTQALAAAGETVALRVGSMPEIPARTLPFVPPAPGSDPGIALAAPRDPPPPRRRLDTIGLDEAPAGDALPFEDDSLSAPTQEIRVKPRRPLPESAAVPEGPGATQRLDAAAVVAALRAQVAPFPLAAPGEAPAAPAAPIPGAPFGQPDAPASRRPEEIAPHEDELEQTMPFRVVEAPVVEPSAAGPSPWAQRTIGEMAVHAATVPESGGAPAPAPTPEIRPPELLPAPEPPREPEAAETSAPPAPPTPAPPAKSREGVLASIAAREPLSGRDLSGLDLSGLDLSGCALDGANLRAATLTRAVLSGASLAGANLQRAIGVGADLSGANLEGADLQKARFTRASFDGAKLRGVLASKADFSEARFAHADLRGASLRGATLRAAIFEGAKLDDADLRNADVEGAEGLGA